MNAFHVIGALAAIWAVTVAVIGITKEDFPGRAEKIVGAVSVVIVIATISAAVITSANEDEEHGGGAEEATSESH
jgi:Mn2+/Fe2+ NRAMP family transporter